MSDWFTDEQVEKAAKAYERFCIENLPRLPDVTTNDIARAALRAVNPYEWRPIGEAKQDGTPIIGACFEGYPENRFCGRELWWQKEFEAWIAGARVNELAPGYTFEDGSTRRLHSPDIYHPTHYMPLPPSPKEGK